LVLAYIPMIFKLIIISLYVYVYKTRLAVFKDTSLRPPPLIKDPD